ncbi:MAG: hypothetical protein AABW87_02240, partial [Nanoarchaeota archaeon]
MGLKSKSFFQMFVLILAIFSVADFTEVSAAEQKACCEKTTSGEFCQYTEASNCDQNFNQASSQCSQTQFCGNVCCYQQDQGICSKSVPLSLCLSNGGTPIQDPKCDVPQCELGCCQIGNSYTLKTEEQCKILSNQYPGLEDTDNFDENLQDEQACLEQGKLQEEGCCISDSGACSFTTRELCDSSNLNANNGKEGFYKGTYCSSSILTACNECKQQAKKGCFDNNAYWFDSCGNKEGLADECGSDSVCTEEDGGAFCKSLDCEDTQDYQTNLGSLNEQLQTAEQKLQKIISRKQDFSAQLLEINNKISGMEETEYYNSTEKDDLENRRKTITTKIKNLEKQESDIKEEAESLQKQAAESMKMGGARLNGESWCVYESPVGDFKDYPGTKHYKHYCFQGKEYAEPCRDFREEICVQGSYTNRNGKIVSNSQCLENNYAQKSNSEIAVNMSTVPLGLNFWESYDPEDRYSPNRDAIEVCKRGNSKCKVTYAKSSYAGDWECVANCECEKQETLNRMALYCKAQGDCGADLNAEQEKSTEGLKVRWEGNAPGPKPKNVGENFWNKLREYGVFGGMQELVKAYDNLLSRGFTEGSGFHFGGRFDPGAYTEFTEDLVRTFGPYGLFFAVILGVYKFILGKYFDFAIGSDTKTKTLYVKCNPYVPPLSGDDCKKCNEDSLHPCTEYKCRSLGATCQLINDGTSQVDCVDTNPNDVSPPDITPWQESITSGYTAQETPAGYIITPDVEPFTPITIAIQTNEPALCNYDTKHTPNFDEMENELSDIFSRTHNLTLDLPNGDTYKYYVRCQDAKGYKNIAEYEIIITKKSGPDWTPPSIVFTSIENGAFIPYNATSPGMTLYVDEP